MTEKEKRIGLFALPIMVCFVVFAGLFFLWIQEYRQCTYENVSSYVQTLIKNNPEVEQEALVSLKEYSESQRQNIKNNTFLKQYGYRQNDFENGIAEDTFLYMFIIFGVLSISWLGTVIYDDQRRKKRIEGLTKYLEQVNTKTGGSLLSKKEDEFSMLQDEIYKTVTNLFQTKEAALQAKKNFADNLANIAHQIKTPITAALLSLQLMKKNCPNRYEEQIEKQLKRLNWMEESLLMLSKIDAGTLHLEKQNIDIYTVLHLATENLSDLLEKEQVKVSIPDNGCVTIEGDLEWTMEACMNLLKNCMEHSSKGGCIYCDYALNPLYAEIRIWDEGEGFMKAEIPHLFERFYRGESTVTNGIGIGLALAREIIEMQNGTIRAYNLTGRGACFEIRFYRH